MLGRFDENKEDKSQMPKSKGTKCETGSTGMGRLRPRVGPPFHILTFHVVSGGANSTGEKTICLNWLINYYSYYAPRDNGSSQW